VVTGQKDVSAAAKVVKTFGAEFDKPKIRFGYLKNQRLESGDIMALADLPSIEILRGKLLGVFSAPATKLVTLLGTPATQLARVLKARAEKEEASAPAAQAAPAAA
jgi:large subunit ribosomal protein L10